MALTRIHVNRHVIAKNRIHGTHEPPLRVKTRGKNFPAYQVRIDGPSWVVYSPQKPLSCGATVWIETHAEVHHD
jgi:hypothetical protein